MFYSAGVHFGHCGAQNLPPYGLSEEHRVIHALEDNLTVALPAELDRVLRDYETEWRAGNAVGLAQLFSADGFVLSGDRPPVRGRAAIERSYAQADGSLHLRALAFAAADSVGYIVGAYTNDPAGPDQGKFLLALVRKAGRWLIAADMDRSTRTPNP